MRMDRSRKRTGGLFIGTRPSLAKGRGAREGGERATRFGPPPFIFKKGIPPKEKKIYIYKITSKTQNN